MFEFSLGCTVTVIVMYALYAWASGRRAYKQRVTERLIDVAVDNEKARAKREDPHHGWLQ